MKTRKVETWTWVLIYGGLILLSIGLAVHSRLSELGLALSLGGGVVAAAGFALIGVRSRMKDQ